MRELCGRRVATLARRRLGGAPALPLPPLSSPARLTLCLDLDESLIHAEVSDDDPPSFREVGGAEAARQSMRRSRVASQLEADFELELPYLEHPVLVYKRPLLGDFLQEVAKMADLVLFTSAADSYAAAVAAQLDPDGELFAAVLSRAQCTDLGDGIFAKDLTALGRPLERTILVDDAPTSFVLQPNNGVPVPPFFGDVQDRALPTLLPLLRTLHTSEDVRPRLRDDYRLHEALLGTVGKMR